MSKTEKNVVVVISPEQMEKLTRILHRPLKRRDARRGRRYLRDPHQQVRHSLRSHGPSRLGRDGDDSAARQHRSAGERSPRALRRALRHMGAPRRSREVPAHRPMTAF